MHKGGSGSSVERGKWRTGGGDNITDEQEIIEEVLKRVKPTREEQRKINEAVKAILKKIGEEVEKRGINAKPVLVGSVAKGTHLKNPDIDVFILFSTDYSIDEMEKLGLEIARAILSEAISKYAEHPYLRGKWMGFDTDVVPSYHVDRADMKITAVDRTPFHTEYVRKKLEDEKRDDVRLLKAFMKGIGVYGAEARVQGFSGYLCELLILKYGSFINVLKNAAKWRHRVQIRLENGEFRKFDDPFVFIDPVDPNRNVASALSERSKSIMTFASHQFLKTPSIKFFFPNPVKPLSYESLLRKIRKRKSEIFVVIFPKQELIDDILYPQMRRTMDAFVSILHDFHPLNSFYFANATHVYFIIELERAILPRIKKHEGPPVWTDNADKFYEKWKNEAFRGPYIEGYRIYADVERKLRTVDEVLRKGVENYKLGKSFDKMKEEMQIAKLVDVLNKMDLARLTEFIEFKFPWER